MFLKNALLDRVNRIKAVEVELAKDGQQIMEFGKYANMKLIDIARMKGGFHYLDTIKSFSCSNESIYKLATQRWNYKSKWSDGSKTYKDMSSQHTASQTKCRYGEICSSEYTGKMIKMSKEYVKKLPKSKIEKLERVPAKPDKDFVWTVYNGLPYPT